MNDLKLHKKIFDLCQITLASEAFLNIATINIDETEDHYMLYFYSCKYSTERTVREFENYLIDLTNKNQKW